MTLIANMETTNQNLRMNGIISFEKAKQVYFIFLFSYEKIFQAYKIQFEQQIEM